LLSALERYDQLCYELVLLTADGRAVLRQGDEWLLVELRGHDVSVRRLSGPAPGIRRSRWLPPVAAVFTLLTVAALALVTIPRPNAPDGSLAPYSTGTAIARSTEGRILRGSVPASGYGLLVFGGGSEEELLAASGCPPATAVFWATDHAGDFVTLVHGARVEAVNDEWKALFPSGIPAGTPLLARCVPDRGSAGEAVLELQEVG
jgi:hypothetical protein